MTATDHLLFHGTAAKLKKLGLIETRPGSEKTDIFWNKSPIVDLTDAGRAHPAATQGDAT